MKIFVVVYTYKKNYFFIDIVCIAIYIMNFILVQMYYYEKKISNFFLLLCYKIYNDAENR